MTLHATALRYGSAGLLIRGPSGAGKSVLALMLLREGARQPSGAALVADDRVETAVANGRLLARAPAVLFGRIELRGVGILALAAEERVAIDLVVDLVPPAEVPRLPDAADLETVVEGLTLPRLTAPRGAAEVALLMIEARLGLPPLHTRSIDPM